MNSTVLILNLDYKKISGKGVDYRLLRDLIYHTDILPPKMAKVGLCTLHVDGTLFLSKGYAWNGANFVFDTDSVMRASLVHDALCELYAENLLAKSDVKKMNDIYRNISKEDGASWIRYKTHRLLLRKGWQGLFS